MIITTLTLLLITGLGAATSVSNTDASGEMGPDTTDNLIHEFTIDASQDNVLHTGSGVSAGDDLVDFGDLTSSSKFGYVDDDSNDGDGSSGYQDGDDVFTVAVVHDGTTDIGPTTNDVQTFSSNTVFVEDGSSSGNYNDGDDLYTTTTQTGSPTFSDLGTDYETFQDTTEYINDPSSASATFDGSQPIVTGNSDNTLGNDETVQRDGSAGILSDLSGTNYQHWNDASGTDVSYDAQSRSHGEPIYDNSVTGAGTVETDDTRVTSVTVNSGTDDNDVSTIDLGLGIFTIVGSSDADNSKDISGNTTSVKVIQYDYGGDNSAPAWDAGTDDVILDVDGDDTVSEGDIVLTANDPAVSDHANAGDQLTSTQAGDISSGGPSDIHTGVTHGIAVDGNSDHYLDIGDDTATSTPDIKLNGGPSTVDSNDPGIYNDVTGFDLDIWDADSSGGVSVQDSVYLDVNGDGTVSNSDSDVRLSGFEKTFSAGSSPSTGDVDVGISIADFDSDEKYLDDSDDGVYDQNEAIVQSSDQNYESGDTVLVEGTISNTVTDFRSGSSPFDAFEGTGTYSGTEPIVTVTSDYSTTSGTRNTLPSADSIVTLNGFETGTSSVEGYISTDSTYDDDEEIVRLDRFSTTSGTPRDIGDSATVTLNAFASSVKFKDPDGDNLYDDDEPIIDDSDTNNVYGDTLTDVTVDNDGGLTDSAVGSVKLYKEDGSTGGFQSNEDTELGSVSNFGSTISGLSDSTDSTQTYYLAADIPSDISASEDDNTVQADPSTTTKSGDNPDPSQNGNAQTVNVPHVTEIASKDTGPDGQIDRVTVSFSEDVVISEGNSGDAFTGFTLDNEDFAAADANYDTTANTVDIDLSSPVGDTSSTTSATYDSSDTIQLSGGPGELTQDMSQLTQTDDAAPVVNSAAYRDSNEDGTVDKVDVDFSEAVDYSPSTISNDWNLAVNDLTGLTLDSKNTENTEEVVLDATATDITGVGLDTEPAIDISDTSTVTDTSGNNAETSSQVSLTDEASPVIDSASTADDDTDGQVDAIDVVLTEPIDDAASTFDGNTFSTGDGEASVDGSSAGDGTDDDSVEASISGAPSDDTAFTLSDLTLSNGVISDGSNSIGSSYTLNTVSDGAAPVAVSGTFSDQNDNGKVDQGTLTFSEDIESPSSLEAGDFAVSGTNSNILGGVSVSNPTFSAADTVEADLTEGSVDTALTGGISLVYTASAGNGDSITDGSNPAPDTSSTLTDNAAPVATSASYTDSGSDGTVDQADVTFSEEVSYGAYSDGDWSVTTNGFTTFEVTDKSSVGTSTVTLDINADSEVTGVSSEPQIDIASEGVVTATSGSNTDADTRSTPLTMTDNAAPVITAVRTYDVDDDGDVGAATLTASEAMDGNLGTASDYEIGGTDASTVNPQEYTDDSGAIASDSADKFRVELADGDEIDGTDAKEVNYDGSSATDSSENNLVELTDGDVDETDGAQPLVTGAGYKDSNDDGTVDKVDVDFSESVDYTSSGTPSNDWSLTSEDLSGLSISDSTGDSSGSEITLEASADEDITGVDSGTEPSVDISDTSTVTDGSSNNAVQAGEVSMTDEAAPSFKSVTTVDSDTNGKLDGLTVEFTEAISDGSVEKADLSIGSGDGLSGSIDAISGNDDGDSTVTVDLSEGSSTDTGANPSLSYTQNDGNSNKIQDSNTNLMADQTSDAATDNANPVATETVTQDGNTDGDIDQVQIKFSEAVNLNDGSNDGIPGLTLTDSDMAISDSDYSDGESVTVGLESDVSGTSATTGLSYSSGDGNVADQNEGLELETDVTQSDGASPVLLNAEIDHDGSSSSVTQVDLKFSESINSGTGDVLTDQTGIDLNVDSSPSSDIVTATAQDSDVDTVLQTGDGPKVTDVSVLGDGDSNSAELFEGSDVEIDTFRRQIGSGWNFVSFPIADGSSYAIQDLMPTENVDAIWTYDGEWKRFAPGEEENDFTEVKGGVGYQVKASDSFTLAPNVNNVDPDTGDQEVPTESVGLQNGWNLVGQFQEFEQVADQTGAFGSISADNLGEVREQSTGTDLQVIKQMNQDTTSNVLQVGEAYWVWAKESVAYTLAS